jgi:hypothetical protein
METDLSLILSETIEVDFSIINIDETITNVIEFFKKSKIKLSKKIFNIRKGTEISIYKIMQEYVKSKEDDTLKQGELLKSIFTDENKNDLIELVKEARNEIVGEASVKKMHPFEIEFWQYLVNCEYSGMFHKFIKNNNSDNTEMQFIGDKDLLNNYITGLTKIKHKSGTNVYSYFNKKYKQVITTLNNPQRDFLVPLKIDSQTDSLIENIIPLQTYAKKVINDITLDEEHISTMPIKPISFDKNEPCFCYIPYNEEIKPYMDRSIEELEELTSTWWEFEHKLMFNGNNKDQINVFRQFIWSLFESKDTGQQMLALYGNGSDGKSVVCNVISDVIGPNGCCSMNDDTLNSDFGFSTIWNKILGKWDDTKMHYPLSNGKIHSLISRGDININIKNDNAFTARFAGKLIMCTNNMFGIKNEINEIRRLLFLKVGEPNPEIAKKYLETNNDGSIKISNVTGKRKNKGDRTFYKRLMKEVYIYLALCKKTYMKYNPDFGDIQISDELEEYMLQDVLDDVDSYTYKGLEINENAVTPVEDLEHWFNTKAPQKLRDTLYSKRKFIQDIIQRFNLKKVRRKYKGHKTTVILGIEIKQYNSDEITPTEDLMKGVF